MFLGVLEFLVFLVFLVFLEFLVLLVFLVISMVFCVLLLLASVALLNDVSHSVAALSAAEGWGLADVKTCSPREAGIAHCQCSFCSLYVLHTYAP